MQLRCGCGHVFQIDEKAGERSVKCPCCGQEAEVPQGSGGGAAAPEGASDRKRSALDYDLEELELEEPSVPVSEPKPPRAPGPQFDKRAPTAEASESVPGTAEPSAFPSAAEEEAEAPDVFSLVLKCLFKPANISELDLYGIGRKNTLTQIAALFLVLNVVPSVFEAVRIRDTFLAGMGMTLGMYFLRIVAISIFIGLVKLLTEQLRKSQGPATGVVSGVLLTRCLALLLFVPVASLNVPFALLGAFHIIPGGLVRGIMYASLWVSAMLAFFYQAFLLRKLLGPGCLSLVFINAVGVYATHRSASWFLTKFF